jgi:hypothetical protein
MEHKEEYRKFIISYLEKHSPFKLNDSVKIKMYNNNRPYQVTRIRVFEDGEIYYNVTSPRSHATIPNNFKMNELEKFL